MENALISIVSGILCFLLLSKDSPKYEDTGNVNENIKLEIKI